MWRIDGVRIESGQTMKVLGWHFSDRPNVDAFIDALSRRFRERYWTLCHLKHNGFSNENLVKVYTSVVRPVADYMQEAYHSLMTDSQDEGVERLKNHTLKCIFGPRISARRMQEMAELTTLRARRIEACNKSATKCADSDRFFDWFPKKPVRRLTRNAGGEEFLEEYARCDRLFNSPIFYMCRHLNGKPGKLYGARNQDYREG